MEAWLQITIALLLVCVAMYVIKFACDSFEPAADYLGTEVYNLGPGIRGASIEAVASSLPELFTTLFLLFGYHDEDGFAAGIATCAGSAIFNGAVIPAICIMAVTMKGVEGEKIEMVALQRSTLVRDGAFFLAALVMFILFLNSSALSWWMGLCLMGLYVCYAIVLVMAPNAEEEDEGQGEEEGNAGGGDPEDAKGNPLTSEDDAEGETGGDETGGDDDDGEKRSCAVALVTFDMNALIFDGADFTASNAWVVLIASTVVIALACYVLAESVMLSALGLGVEPYFTAVILGAAASSVPDTFLSYKDALKGDYDDAVANAIGSNIFDICFALGFPLFLYGLIYGDVQMSEVGGSVSGGSDKEQGEIQSLQVMLMGATFLIMATFLVTKTDANEAGQTVHLVGKTQAGLLLSIYFGWTLIIILQAAGVVSV
jgi:cation:H+ antiporter